MNPEELQKMTIPEGTLWLPKAASTVASAVDDPFWIIYWTCVITFVLIIAPMFYFAWRYKRRTEGQRAESQADHNQMIEISWSVLPLIFFIFVFVVGFRGYLNLYVAPANAMQLRVTGQKWFWNVSYPCGASLGGQGEAFVVPAQKPIKLTLTSTDVLHSFFVPNFRIKQDAVPGRYTTLWFEATEPGEYPLLCAEYCGKDHSNMLGKIKVLPQAEFDTWYQGKCADVGGAASVERGQKVYEKYCLTCHTNDGTPRVGPTFKGLFGRQETFTDGSSVTVDDNYILESILEPTKKVVQGFPPAMPPFKGVLSQKEIDSIIMYVKTLK